MFSRIFPLLMVWLFSPVMPATAAAGAKPVLLYSLHFQARGEDRYAADGTYREVLSRLREEFEVRISTERPTSRQLRDVDLVLLANPNDVAHGTNPPPPHMAVRDVRVLERFVGGGGGLIVLGNQEGHNLELSDMNRLLGKFGLQLTNRFHDAKLIPVDESNPVIGGLNWGYYTGNEVLLRPDHSARPVAWVENPVGLPTATGRRNEPGILLAAASPGRGRVVVATDAGWITDNVLAGRGIGGVSLHGQDNFQIFLRICRWTAGQSVGR